MEVGLLLSRHNEIELIICLCILRIRNIPRREINYYGMCACVLTQFSSFSVHLRNVVGNCRRRDTFQIRIFYFFQGRFEIEVSKAGNFLFDLLCREMPSFQFQFFQVFRCHPAGLYRRDTMCVGFFRYI